MVRLNQTTPLAEVLSAESCTYELSIDEIADSVVARIWWAVFESQNLQDDKAEQLRSGLRHTIHWAIHIGQSAWHLQQFQSTAPTNPDEWPSGWEIIVDELYLRPFIMMDSEKNFHDLLIHTDIQRGPWLSGAELRKRWDQQAVFTHARLVGVQSQVGCSIEPMDLGSSPPVFKLVAASLCAKANLYLEFLNWLVCSRERNKIKISDCLVNLCALALSMSGDALRLTWPI